MEVTVSFREATIAAFKGDKDVLPKLSSLVENNCRAQLLDVYGREQFVAIEITESEFKLLRERIGKMCVFMPKVEAEPF